MQGNRLCKREYVENAYLKESKLSILRKVNKRNSSIVKILHYCLLNQRRLNVILYYVFKNFIGSMSWLRQTRQQIILSLFDGSTTSIFLSKNGGTKAYELRLLIEERSVVNDHTYHSAS